MMPAAFPTQPESAESAFFASMPARYREAFDATEAREHAAIVSRRGGAPVHLEIWRRIPQGGAILCVVGDDRPGLLCFISAALLVHQMDVIGAKVFTRDAAATGPGRGAEAIDFFTIHRDAALALPVLRADIARVGDVLGALVRGELTVESVVRQSRALRPAPRGAATHATFDDGAGDGLAELTVHTFDRPGLLLSITQALFRAEVQIIASEATTRDGRVVDRFSLAELDGSPISRQKRGIVQMEVLGAIDALARGSLS
jgi:UTP:GlnB (protein PII) uridylyltransferase